MEISYTFALKYFTNNINTIMANKTNSKSETSSEVKEEKKRVNPTWAAILKCQPAFTYVAPEMFD